MNTKTEQQTKEFVIEIVPWIDCHDCIHQSELPSLHEGKHPHQSYFYASAIRSVDVDNFIKARKSGIPIVYVKKDRNGNIIGKFGIEDDVTKIKEGEKI